MTPRVSFSPTSKTPVGESFWIAAGCLTTLVAPPYWACRWIIRKIVERTRNA